MRRSFFILALCAAAAGCEPSWSVQGHAQAAEAATAETASAVLRCPGQVDQSTEADGEGVFEIGGTGAGPSLDCVVIVTAPGRTTATVALRDACEDTASDRCSVALIEVPLARAR